MAAMPQATLNGPIEASKELTPFNLTQGCSADRWRLGTENTWLVASDAAKMARWTELFSSAAPEDGRLTGGKAKALMMESRLPNSVLSKVWSLADTDRDGLLTLREFCLAMYLIDIKLAGPRPLLMLMPTTATLLWLPL